MKGYWSQWDRLAVRDGVLQRRWEEDNGKECTWQLLVPESLTAVILRELHDSKTAGHLGVAKTLGRVKQRYYWYRCTQDVRDWCRKCDLCAARKKPQKAPRGPMKKYNVGAPLERVALDILGPLPETDSDQWIARVRHRFRGMCRTIPQATLDAKQGGVHTKMAARIE